MARRASEKLQAMIGREPVAACLTAIRNFQVGGAWRGDNPEIDEQVDKLNTATEHRAILRQYVGNQPRVLHRAEAAIQRRVLGVRKRRQRPPLPDKFKRMETEMMDILVTALPTKLDAAKWTLLLIEERHLRPSARYSAAAILKRWRSKL